MGKGHVLFYTAITKRIRQHITVAIRKTSQRNKVRENQITVSKMPDQTLSVC